VRLSLNGVLGWCARFAQVIAISVAMLAGLYVMTLERGEAAMARSDAAFDQGQLQTALDEARVAAACALPFASHVRAADDRLLAIAVGAEAHGNDRLARRAWAALRGAALERRHPFSSEPTLEQADRQLARLLAAASAEKKERVFSEEQLLAELRDSRPRTWGSPWGAIALVPLFAALGAVFLPRRQSSSGVRAC
jgi:hypothetical protein